MSLHKLSLILSLTAVAAGSTLIALPAAHAQTAYAIGGGGTSLISFSLTNPGAVSSVNFSGGSLDGLDFSPSNGLLYGYDNAAGTLYTVSTATGALTAVSSGAGATNTFNLGLGFDPTGTGRVLHIATNATDNVSYNTATSNPSAVTGPSLFYVAGDAATTAGDSPHINEIAYSNNVAGAASTVEYGIDYMTDSLVTINSATGAINTVGAKLGNLGVTISPNTGFVGLDILSTAVGGGTFTNSAYGVFDATDGAAPTLYSINLTTGAASAIGAVGGTEVYGLAIRPNAAAAPEPGPLMLMASATLPMIGGTAFRRRRILPRRRAA